MIQGLLTPRLRVILTLFYQLRELDVDIRFSFTPAGKLASFEAHVPGESDSKARPLIIILASYLLPTYRRKNTKNKNRGCQK